MTLWAVRLGCWEQNCGILLWGPHKNRMCSKQLSLLLCLVQLFMKVSEYEHLCRRSSPPQSCMTPPGIYQSRQCVASLKDIYFLGTTGLTGRKEVVTEGRTGMKGMYNKGTGERLFVGKSV